jgi:hypothetical protein
MYRVYDKKEKKWSQDNFYLSKNEDLYISKKSWFGREKLTLVPSIQYVWQKDIGLYDKNDTLIYEGDICKIESLDIAGIITYVSEFAAFVLLDYDNNKYYELSKERCSNDVVIVGNIFENQVVTNFEKEAIDEDWEIK